MDFTMIVLVLLAATLGWLVADFFLAKVLKIFN